MQKRAESPNMHKMGKNAPVCTDAGNTLVYCTPVIMHTKIAAQNSFSMVLKNHVVQTMVQKNHGVQTIVL